MQGWFAVMQPETGFEMYAATVAASRERAVATGIAKEADVDALIDALRAASKEGYDWVTLPFMLDVTMRKPR
jgi:hypothetical protein